MLVCYTSHDASKEKKVKEKRNQIGLGKKDHNKRTAPRKKREYTEKEKVPVRKSTETNTVTN
jgi:hypothetical protein